MRRGRLVRGARGDIGVRADLAAVWEPVCRRLVGDVRKCRVVLLVDDAASERDILTMCRVLAEDLGVAGFNVCRESVAVTYATGLSRACVVNIGDQRTTVSVVWDGGILPGTTRCLNLGAVDSSCALLTMVRDQMPAALRFAHQPAFHMGMRDAASLRTAGMQLLDFEPDHTRVEHTHVAKRQGRETTATKINIPTHYGVAACQVLFEPEFLGFVDFGESAPAAAARGESPADDATWVLECAASSTVAVLGNRMKKHRKTLTSAPKGASTAPESVEAAAVVPPALVERDDTAGGIHNAVFSAIMHASGADVARQQLLFKTIVVTGGAALIHGLAEEIESQVFQLLPDESEVETVEVVQTPSPHTTPCVGATLISKSGSMDALYWVSQGDWLRKGAQALREDGALLV